MIDYHDALELHAEWKTRRDQELMAQRIKAWAPGAKIELSDPDSPTVRVYEHDAERNVILCDGKVWERDVSDPKYYAESFLEVFVPEILRGGPSSSQLNRTLATLKVDPKANPLRVFLPADLTGWKYENLAEELHDWSGVTLCFYPSDPPAGFSSADSTAGLYDIDRDEVHVYRIESKLLSDLLVTLKHELRHWAQYFLQKSGPFGVPKKKYTPWNESTPHYARDIEFYPNLGTDLDYFMQGRHLDDPNLLQKARRYFDERVLVPADADRPDAARIRNKMRKEFMLAVQRRQDSGQLKTDTRERNEYRRLRIQAGDLERAINYVAEMLPDYDVDAGAEVTLHGFFPMIDPFVRWPLKLYEADWQWSSLDADHVMFTDSRSKKPEIVSVRGEEAQLRLIRKRLQDKYAECLDYLAAARELLDELKTQLAESPAAPDVRPQ